MVFSSPININEKYFHMPFGPTILAAKDVGLKRIPFTNLYTDIQTGTRWRQCLLYDTGWGKPVGYERIPELQFDDLIKLALCSDHKMSTLKVSEEESNKYGSIAVIMERHTIELIDFLANNLENESLFKNPLFNQNLKLFGFFSEQTYTQNWVYSYESLLSKYSCWSEIAPIVKKHIYINND